MRSHQSAAIFMILYVLSECALIPVILKSMAEDQEGYSLIEKCLSDVVIGDISPVEEVIAIFKGMNATITLRTKSPTVILTEAGLHEKSLDLKNGDIVYVFSELVIREILKHFNWRDSTKFIVFIRLRSQLEVILEEFWAERIFNVVVMLYTNQTVEMFTYFPYSQHHCEGLGVPKRLGVCHNHGVIRANAFPRKTENLHGCPLVITLVERAPAVINKQGEAHGVETEILRTIASSINAKPEFYFLKGKLRLYHSNGNSILLELLENHSHIVAGSLFYTASANLVSDGVEYPVTMCVTFIAPLITQPTYRHLFSNIIPVRILAGIVISTVVGAASIFFLLKPLDPRISLRTTISEFLYSGHKIPGYVTVRIFLALWLLTAFLLTSMFEASVGSSVIAPSPLPQLETLEDVLKTGLLVDGQSFLIKYVLGERITKREKNENCGCSLDQTLTMIAEVRDRVFIDVRFNLIYNLLKMPEIEKKIHFSQKCILHFRPVIQLRKKSPFFQTLKTFMEALGESGIIGKAFDNYKLQFTMKERHSKSTLRPLTLQNLKGSFLLLFIGLGLSSFSFIFEFLYHRIRKTGREKRDNTLLHGAVVFY